MKERIRRNKFLAFAISMTSAVTTMVISGTLMQTFLAKLGLSTNLIYIHSTVALAVNVAALVLSSRWVAPHNVIKRAALITIPYALTFLTYIPICLKQQADMKMYFVLLAICVFQVICMALRTVCAYALPYLLYPVNDYGPFTAITGTAANILTLILGAVISKLVETVPFITLMIGAFSLTTVLLFIEVGLTLMQRSILPKTPAEEKKEPEKTGTLRETFRHPAFSTLIFANLTRGIASGTIGILAAMAFDLGFTEAVTTRMVSIQSAVSLVSCMLIGVISKYRPPRLETMLGSLSFLLLPLIFLRNEFVFLAIFAIVFFGRNIVDYSVPILLRRAVPLHIAGPYNAWRMVLHNGGSVIATGIAAFIPNSALIVITVICSAASGLSFFFSKVLIEADKNPVT